MTHPWQAALHIHAPSGESYDRLGQILDEDLRWVSGSALCAQTDADTFFPGKGGSLREAKRICGVCPLLAECLEYALTHHVYGVWGGTSISDRRRMGGVQAA